MKHDLLSFSFAMDTLVPEVFLDFSSRKRSRASRVAATTSAKAMRRERKTSGYHGLESYSDADDRLRI